MHFKNFLLIALLLIGVLSCAAGVRRKQYSEDNDLYWSQLVEETRNSKMSILAILKKENPHLYDQIEKDSLDPNLLSFWGKSYNFDSGAKKKIIDDQIISDLQEKFHIKNDNEIVHAGITHTYGYLFSVLDTPYGFKRKRWIRPTLNYGFAFMKNSLSPETMEGGLLSNLTYFAGMIAFKEEQRKALKKLQNVSSEVLNFDYSKLSVEKVDEDIMDGGAHVSTLKTSLVRLPFKQDGEENEYLLVYSSSNPLNKKEVLITAFPISKDAYKKIVDPEGLGPKRPIQIRYNAYLEGLMGRALTGTRRLY
ncbi:MAG: hypothetical protein ACXVLQ_04700 [Bacteriovorax sp.]